MLNIYTDGSTKGNGTANSTGGYAVVLMDDWDRVLDCYAETNIPDTTNNRMELTAILASIVLYGHYYGQSYVAIYTDSKYARNCFTDWLPLWMANGWRKNDGSEIKNLDLIQQFLDVAYDGFPFKKVQWDIYHVPGHSSYFGNELADKLATGEMTCEEVMEKYGKKETD